MVTIFSGLNVALGLTYLVISWLAVLHLAKKFRFSPQQERTALRFVAFGMLFTGINFASSGLLGTLQNYANIAISLPTFSIIPLAAKVLAGASFWGLIFWVLFWFYPTQQRKS